MKIGDNVWISWQDIEACGYGDSVNTNGTIVYKYPPVKNKCGRFLVRYKEDNYPFREVERDFWECDLTLT